MPERPDFQKKQYAFAAHIRDPDNVPAPEGIENRRMAIYRKLFFNNLVNLLATMFPVLRKIHSEKHWRGMIRQFMQRHQAETPYFLKLPEEFLGFLEAEYVSTAADHPFLLELAHYEYIELALSVSTAENDMNGVDPDGDLLAGIPVKSELAWAFAYHYPVHRISPEFLPTEPEGQPVYLAIYRGSNDKVRFLELNAVTAGLLDALENNQACRNGEALIQELARMINYSDETAFLKHGGDALTELRRLKILTGTRRAA